MKQIIFIIITVTLLATTSFADDDEQFDDFESIVKNLSHSTAQLESPSGLDPFDLVKLHFSVGVVNNYLRLSSNQGLVSGFESGMQATLGVDLFSPNWMAEGTVRSFSETAIDDILVSMREFDLKIAYRIYPNRSLVPYLGFGVAASYLDIKENSVTPEKKPVTRTEKYSTPNSILFAGANYRFTDGLGMGLECSYRSPMVEETIQRSSLDMAVRLNTTF